jgi:hypothetical protein
MNIGMLWFDNDPKTDLATKIEHAAEYYRKKYGKRPNLCFIHPSMAPPQPEASQSQDGATAVFTSGNVEVRITRSVLPNHLWIGVNGANGQVNP